MFNCPIMNINEKDKMQNKNIFLNAYKKIVELT
jgi:hypothetical protein